MKINKQLPIKYHLNLHLSGDSINEDSIMFEIVRYLVNQLNKKDDPDYSNIKFTSKTLKYVFGDRMKEDEFKNLVIKILKNNISIGMIETKNKNLLVTDKLLSKFYVNK